MKIKYEVYLRNYSQKQTDKIGFFIDFWQGVDFARGMKLARQYYGHLVKDPNAIFVLGRKESNQ